MAAWERRGGRLMAHVQAAGETAAERAAGRDRQQAKIVLDDVSRHIIEQLQQDGRRSYAAIGKAVGLSEAAVRQRVQRLIDAGAMQIVAVTDPMTLGFRRQTMIGVRGGGGGGPGGGPGGARVRVGSGAGIP